MLTVRVGNCSGKTVYYLNTPASLSNEQILVKLSEPIEIFLKQIVLLTSRKRYLDDFVVTFVRVYHTVSIF